MSTEDPSAPHPPYLGQGMAKCAICGEYEDATLHLVWRMNTRAADAAIPPDQPREYAIPLLPDEAAALLKPGRCKECGHLDALHHTEFGDGDFTHAVICSICWSSC